MKNKSAAKDKLASFIKIVLIGLCLAFILTSSIQLYIFNKQILDFQEFRLNPVLDSLYTHSTEASQIRWWTLSELEVYAINQRYHQAHVLLMSRIWIQYLSFFMGIVLITIGSVFIFGKVSDFEQSSLDVDSKFFGRILFRSTSPGLYLALFGVILVIFSFAYQRNITVVDSSVYLRGYQQERSGSQNRFQEFDSTMYDSGTPVLDPNAEHPPEETGF